MGLTAAISIQGVSFAYHKFNVLKDVNAQIESEKLSIILGRNGSGKSTFLKLLAGILHPQQGTIQIWGEDITQLKMHERSNTSGYLSQQHKAVFPFSVEDVVLTGRAGHLRFIPGKHDRQASLEAMEKTGIIHLQHRTYTELSGGEQQLVMIARLLAQKPKILLLDEPTSHLDFVNQSHLLVLLKRLVSEGLTVIAVLHDPNLAFFYGDNFLFFKEGSLIFPPTDTPWDAEFLKRVYHNQIDTIPYQNRAIIVPVTQ